MNNPKWILAIIVISQFCCTSLWFAGNGVLENLIADFGLNDRALGHLTSAVQFGFISGTLVFAMLTLADRYSPSRVFFFSAFIAGIINLGMLWNGNTLLSLLGARFLTGFFLAGIYPVGMKIAADHFQKGLGKSLSFLVGALVLGTALPHLLKSTTGMYSWKVVILTISGLALLGGLLILVMVPDGPYRHPGSPLVSTAVFKVFKNKNFRSAAFGYFGHMWELYAFWAFIPVILNTYKEMHPQSSLLIPLWSFFIIGVGSIGCVIGGYVSQQAGVKRTGFIILLLSCVCCAISPLAFSINSEMVFIVFLLFWGMVVIADSPLFSTLVANNAVGQLKGSALTIVNCIGFAITIVSIQLLSFFQDLIAPTFLFILLALGPVIGLIGLGSKLDQ